jgi:hypothetical protein
VMPVPESGVIPRRGRRRLRERCRNAEGGLRRAALRSRPALIPHLKADGNTGNAPIRRGFSGCLGRGETSNRNENYSEWIKCELLGRRLWVAGLLFLLGCLVLGFIGLLLLLGVEGFALLLVGFRLVLIGLVLLLELLLGLCSILGCGLGDCGSAERQRESE